MDLLASSVEAVREDNTRVTLVGEETVSVTANNMGEGLEFEQSYTLPPLPRLSVIKEASFDLMQKQPEMLRHKLSVIQERLSNVSKMIKPCYILLKIIQITFSLKVLTPCFLVVCVNGRVVKHVAKH